MNENQILDKNILKEELLITKNIRNTYPSICKNSENVEAM